jgi:hypothetical protein
MVSGGAVVDGGGQRPQQWRSSVGFRAAASGNLAARTATMVPGRQLRAWGGVSQAAMRRGRHLPTFQVASWTAVRGRASPRGGRSGDYVFL